MLTTVQCEWHEYKYFPYEQRLAERELVALVGASNVRVDGHGITVDVPVGPELKNALERTTYFRRVRVGGETLVPAQARRELASRHEGAFEQLELRRQSTRYAAHGLHEYRGKFNPQIVNAIANVLGLRPGSWILDPYCGSGTTLVEAALTGRNAVGLDMNPLAPMIANAKLDALRAEPEHLTSELKDLCTRLDDRFAGADYTAEWANKGREPRAGAYELANEAYLRKWFPEPVLAQLKAILEEIEAADAGYRRLLQVLLSETLREVSLQDPGDLRIRRRKDPQPNYPAVPAFIEHVMATLDRLAQGRLAGGVVEGSQEAHCADSRRDLNRVAASHRPAGLMKFDGALTSPPYASALPYIDTQRLSLALLGLVEAQDLRGLERQILGSRELRPKEQAQHEDRIRSGADAELLGDEVQSLCLDLLRHAQHPDNGFRRRAMPAVIHRYFMGSAQVFDAVRPHMRAGAPYALVVGPNHTTLGGKRFDLATPSLLAATAVTNGWTLEAIEPLETFPRFDLHHRNSIKSEALVILRA